MTANKLTDEQVRETIAALSIVPTSSVNDISFGDIATALAELQERRKAAMDSEPVAWRYRTTDINGNPNPHWSFSEGASLMGLYQPLYTTPPAPVVDSEPVAWWTGPEPTPTGEIESIHDHETGSHIIPLYPSRAAMLQAGNHTEQHLDMVDHFGDANEKVEPVIKPYKLPFDRWLSQQDGAIDIDCGCVTTEAFYHWLRVAYEAGNSPVAPDGYVLVPVVPTEDMIINGFESVPDPHFSDEKEWEEYKSLSGCRQAARRAELCWAAMIKAAPKQENI